MAKNANLIDSTIENGATVSHSSEENSSGSYEGQNTRELRHSIKRQNARIQEEEILQKCKSAIETLTFEVEKHKIEEESS